MSEPETATENATAPDGQDTSQQEVSQDTKAQDWRSMLPDDLRSDPNISKFNSPEALARSYISASSMIGRDKVPLPKTDDEWEGWYKAAGRPDTPAEYEIKPPADLPEGFYDDTSAEWFKTEAHKAGLNTKQAQRLHDQFVGSMLERHKATEAQRESAMAAAELQLKNEWGAAFDNKLKAASAVANELGGEEFGAYLAESGLGNDPRFIKAMAKVAEMTKGESALVGRGAEDPMTPDQIDQEISTYRTTHNTALMDKLHPDHNRAVNGLEALFKKRFPDDKAA